jgi:hypothetical protein
MYSADARTQRALVDSGISGAMAPVVSDYLGVVTQDATPSKLDWFLRRAVAYDATVDPSTGAVDATVTVTLRNTAPATGLPTLAYGSSHWGLGLAESRMYVSVYSPLVLRDADVAGSPVAMESATERGRFVYSTFVVIPPGGAVELRLRLGGTVSVRDGYSLQLASQPGVSSDDMRVRLTRQGSSKPSVSERFSLENDTVTTLR